MICGFYLRLGNLDIWKFEEWSKNWGYYVIFFNGVVIGLGGNKGV